MQKKKALILFGPPAAGKGTLASLCNDNFGWKQLATGNLCREQIAEKSELGMQLEALISAGSLVPDAIIMNMIEQWIRKNQDNIQGIIFDGTPRTAAQAEFIHEMLANKFPHFEIMIVRFDVDEQQLFDRIATRIICSNKSCQMVYSAKADELCEKCNSSLYKRLDDNADSLKNRLKEYYQYEKDVLNYYDKHGYVVHNINANEPIDKVFHQLKEIASV